MFRIGLAWLKRRLFAAIERLDQKFCTVDGTCQDRAGAGPNLIKGRIGRFLILPCQIISLRFIGIAKTCPVTEGSPLTEHSGNVLGTHVVIDGPYEILP